LSGAYARIGEIIIEYLNTANRNTYLNSAGFSNRKGSIMLGGIGGADFSGTDRSRCVLLVEQDILPLVQWDIDEFSMGKFK
jgi:hypothetical protein